LTGQSRELWCAAAWRCGWFVTTAGRPKCRESRARRHLAGAGAELASWYERARFRHCDPREVVSGPVARRARSRPRAESWDSGGSAVAAGFVPITKNEVDGWLCKCEARAGLTLERRDRYPGSKVVRGRCRRRT